jgi:hypothetical protein
MRTAQILDGEEPNGFLVEYDNTQGTKNVMRLDATTYEKAIREIKLFLSINEDNCDEDGNQWQIE